MSKAVQDSNARYGDLQIEAPVAVPAQNKELKDKAAIANQKISELRKQLEEEERIALQVKAEIDNANATIRKAESRDRLLVELRTLQQKFIKIHSYLHQENLMALQRIQDTIFEPQLQVSDIQQIKDKLKQLQALAQIKHAETERRISELMRSQDAEVAEIDARHKREKAKLLEKHCLQASAVAAELKGQQIAEVQKKFDAHFPTAKKKSELLIAEVEREPIQDL